MARRVATKLRLMGTVEGVLAQHYKGREVLEPRSQRSGGEEAAESGVAEVLPASALDAADDALLRHCVEAHAEKHSAGEGSSPRCAAV